MTSLLTEFVGVHAMVPARSGAMVRSVNADHAATTPVMGSVLDAVHELLPNYGSVHRGSGHNARVSTRAYEQARETVGWFVGADPQRDVVIFTKNTTEAINSLAHALRIGDDKVVLTTVLDHHSNDLPWRAAGPTVRVDANVDGSLDLDCLDALIERYRGHIAVLAVCGASNVTGLTPPIHELAERVHGAGGLIAVDAAQLAAHRPIEMLPHDDPRHLDFVSLSAHKMYAPFGSGALIVPRAALAGAPHARGGGTVSAVTVDDVVWADLPEREEAGTPNLIGAVALATAMETLIEIGWDRIIHHEATLLSQMLDAMSGVPGVDLCGPAAASERGHRLPVIPFNLAGVDHGLVAAVLGHEHGIGVRSGCFCAQPYVAHLLGQSSAESQTRLAQARRGDRRGMPGLVRISLGLASDAEDVGRIAAAVGDISRGEICFQYRHDERGDYSPIQ